jgi:GT2 family glycosyltransferase
MHILALCATYNRKEMTLKTLRALKNQKLPSGVSLQLAVVDDASTDDTLDHIHGEFSDILSIKSQGGLYWAGAMRYGFSLFWDPNKYSHLLVFNDDISLYRDALAELIKVSKKHANNDDGIIVSGSFKDPKTHELTYGGLISRKNSHRCKLDRVQPNGIEQPVDTLNMNFALIDKKCLSNNILIRKGFVHGLADYDFGLRASRKGSKLLITGYYSGDCARNSTLGTWEDESLSFLTRLRLMNQPKGDPAYPRFLYLSLHCPLIWPILLIAPYRRLFSIWKKWQPK